MGTSKNRLYVTHGQPIIGAASTHSYQEPFITKSLNSLLYISCKESQGLSDSFLIVSKIFDKFATKSIVGVEDASMQLLRYWKTPNSVVTDVGGLLTTRDGTCQSWGNFFNDMIRLQGIEGSKIVEVKWTADHLFPQTNSNWFDSVLAYFSNILPNVTVSPFHSLYASNQSLPGAYFIVKNWNIDEGLNKCYLARSAGLAPVDIAGQLFYGADALGIAGQGGEPGTGLFGNHIIIKFNNKYYDPSYGTVFDTKEAWEENSIQLMGDLIEVNYSGIFRYFFYPTETNTQTIFNELN